MHVMSRKESSYFAGDKILLIAAQMYDCGARTIIATSGTTRSLSLNDAACESSLQ